jgi:hypothetical protein
VTGALWFLVIRTVRNRIARQLSRLRQPRYALAMAVGLFFVWLIYLRPVDPGSRPEVSDDAARTGATMVQGLDGFIGVTLLVTFAVWWLRGGVSGALAFPPAEVQFLFPAPLSRRMLIAYRVARAQVLVLPNALIWALLTRTWGLTQPLPLRFATAWAFFSLLSLHRLGAALVQTTPVTNGRRAAWIGAQGLAIAAIAGLLAGVAPVLVRFGEIGAEMGLQELGRALSVPPASWALTPTRLIMAPLRSTSPEALSSALVVIGGLVAAHLVWVLSMKVSFEEAAAMASSQMAERLAAFRAGRTAVVARPRKSKELRSRIPLAATGHPAVAIAWKNSVAFVRGGGLRSLVMLAAFIALSVAAMSAFSSSRAVTNPETARELAVMALMPGLMMLAMSFMFGPRMVRNDLRQDLLSLSLIKTYPLRGRLIVLAELVSPAVLLTLFQVVCGVAAGLALPADARARILVLPAITLMACAPLALLVLNAANFAIQNGTALVFPSWARLGSNPAGLEAMGQTVLFALASLLALALSLVVPVGVGASVYVLTTGWYGDLTVVAALMAGVLVLAIEIALIVAALGDVLERTEPSAIV